METCKRETPASEIRVKIHVTRCVHCCLIPLWTHAWLGMRFTWRSQRSWTFIHSCLTFDKQQGMISWVLRASSGTHPRLNVTGIVVGGDNESFYVAQRYSSQCMNLTLITVDFARVRYLYVKPLQFAVCLAFNDVFSGRISWVCAVSYAVSCVEDV